MNMNIEKLTIKFEHGREIEVVANGIDIKAGTVLHTEEMNFIVDLLSLVKRNYNWCLPKSPAVKLLERD